MTFVAVERERIVLARNGKPVAQLGPLPAVKPRRISPDDPLLNLDFFGFDGPGGKLSNKQIDRIVYGT